MVFVPCFFFFFNDSVTMCFYTNYARNMDRWKSPSNVYASTSVTQTKKEKTWSILFWSYLKIKLLWWSILILNIQKNHNPSGHLARSGTKYNSKNIMKRRVKKYSRHSRLAFWLVTDFPLGVRQLALGVLEISLGSIRARGFRCLLILG